MDKNVQYIQRLIDGLVKLQGPSELYDEFHTWLTTLPPSTLHTFIRDVSRFETHATVQLSEMDERTSDQSFRVKAEQSVAFYALALWRKYELRPLTQM